MNGMSHLSKIKAPDWRSVSARVKRFSNVKAIIIGDIILDVFLWGKVNRISPEAPVPVVEIQSETQKLGGAANVANNMASLGASVSIFGRVGRDQEGEKILELLEKSNINAKWVVRSSNEPTTVKTRIVAHSQQVVRFDRENKNPLKVPCKEFRYLLEESNDVDVVVISDYAKGVVTEGLVNELKEWASAKNVPVIVDPKVINAHFYKGVTVVTPNHIEAAQMAGLPYVPEDDAILSEVGKRIMLELGCRWLLITRGSRGMTLFEKGAQPIHMPTVARKVYDVTGAGDTVVATLATAFGAGMNILDAAQLANVAAGYVVGEVGTATISADQLKSFIERGHFYEHS